MLAIGIDVVEVDRWRRLLVRRGQRLLARVFAPEELAGVMDGRLAGVLAGRLAGRWAVKEAVMKALGVKAGSWRDVVVTTGPGGAPEVVLRGGWQEAARARDIAGWHVSISHERQLAVAVAVAWKRGLS